VFDCPFRAGASVLFSFCLPSVTSLVECGCVGVVFSLVTVQWASPGFIQFNITTPCDLAKLGGGLSWNGVFLLMTTVFFGRFSADFYGVPENPSFFLSWAARSRGFLGDSHTFLAPSF